MRVGPDLGVFHGLAMGVSESTILAMRVGQVRWFRFSNCNCLRFRFRHVSWRGRRFGPCELVRTRRSRCGISSINAGSPCELAGPGALGHDKLA